MPLDLDMVLEVVVVQFLCFVEVEIQVLVLVVCLEVQGEARRVVTVHQTSLMAARQGVKRVRHQVIMDNLFHN